MKRISKMLKDTIIYRSWHCTVCIETYANNGSLAIVLADVQDGAPAGTLTNNFDGIPQNCVALDTNNCGNDLPKLLIKNGIITGELVNEIPSGYWIYPVYKLSNYVLEQLK